MLRIRIQVGHVPYPATLSIRIRTRIRIHKIKNREKGTILIQNWIREPLFLSHIFSKLKRNWVKTEKAGIRISTGAWIRIQKHCTVFLYLDPPTPVYPNTNVYTITHRPDHSRPRCSWRGGWCPGASSAPCRPPGSCVTRGPPPPAAAGGPRSPGSCTSPRCTHRHSAT